MKLELLDKKLDAIKMNLQVLQYLILNKDMILQLLGSRMMDTILVLEENLYLKKAFSLLNMIASVAQL